VEKSPKIKDLNKYYDRLQLEYGEKTLSSIYNGGFEECPDVCFVFMNPTGKNIASTKEWKGRRSPWIGTKNIWKLFYNVGLLDKDLYSMILSMKPSQWNEEFADKVYEDVEKNKIFITNLGKCTQIDARPLPDKVLKEYLDLLYKEIEIINPKKIIVFGNQVSSIFLKKKICVKSVRKQEFKIEINNKEYPVYSVFYPIGNGMRNIDLAIEDLKYILNK
jgi:DNA polymerase